MKTPPNIPDWSRISLKSEPEMFVGRRRANRTLEAFRISLHEDTFQNLSDICQVTLERVQGMSPLEYNPYTHPEPGEEYFVVAIGESSENSTTPLAELIRNIDKLELIDSSRLRDMQIQFYGISYQSDQGLVTFLKKSNPKKSLQRGNKFFMFSEHLRSVQSPDLTLEEDIDIILTSNSMATLSPFSFEVLAGDMSFSEENIDQYVSDLKFALQSKLELDKDALEALKSLALRKTSVVKRLKVIHSHLKEATIDQSAVEEVLRKRQLQEKVAFDQDGKVILNEDNVELFLDMIEGRFFKQDFTGNEMRADRVRQRTP